MNKTKKYTIVFVVASFLLIGGIGTYNALNQTVEEVIEEPVTTYQQDNDIKEEQTKEDNSQIKEDTKLNKNETVQTTQETPPSSQSSQEIDVSQPKEVTKRNVTMTITGLEGVISSGTIACDEGSSAFVATKQYCEKNNIPLESTGISSAVYIRAINGLVEGAAGTMSGWKYKVNGIEPNYGCGSFKIKEGDAIEWFYFTNE